MSGKRQNNHLPYHIQGINSGDGGNCGSDQGKNDDDNNVGVSIWNIGGAIKLIKTDAFNNLLEDALATVGDLAGNNLVTAETTTEENLENTGRRLVKINTWVGKDKTIIFLTISGEST